ncbi:unnamed protein product [Lactuca saligna]|uniref:Uncharacterized protein n=1 Tax=Lactuca saligna TaxID=75948 RepID=A0AA35VCY6_LACSI|nr:unnamed protein product [Lactuca saligna]
MFNRRKGNQNRRKKDRLAKCVRRPSTASPCLLYLRKKWRAAVVTVLTTGKSKRTRLGHNAIIHDAKGHMLLWRFGQRYATVAIQSVAGQPQFHNILRDCCWCSSMVVVGRRCHVLYTIVPRPSATFDMFRSWPMRVHQTPRFLAETLDVVQEIDWVISLGNAFAKQVLFNALAVFALREINLSKVTFSTTTFYLSR